MCFFTELINYLKNVLLLYTKVSIQQKRRILLQDVLEILKHSLQNFYKILRNRFLGATCIHAYMSVAESNLQRHNNRLIFVTLKRLFQSHNKDLKTYLKWTGIHWYTLVYTGIHFRNLRMNSEANHRNVSDRTMI